MGRANQGRSLAVDRLSQEDRRVLRRLARSMRPWVVSPDSPGRQGELAGTVAMRVEAARDRVRQNALRELGAARRAIGQMTAFDALIADRQVVRDRARDRLAEIEGRIASDPSLIDPNPPASPEGEPGQGADAPPIAWSRLFLILGFVVLEYFLSLRVPELLGIDGYQVQVVAAAFAMTLVVLPKMVGGSFRDGATDDDEKKRVRLMGLWAALLGTGGAVAASAAIREIVFDAEATDPPSWCLPVLAFAVALASFATSALAPDDARDQAAEARQHLWNEVRRLVRSLRNYIEQRRPLDLARARAKRILADRDAAKATVEQAETAVEAARAQRAETIGELGTARERIGAALVEAEWAERSAAADQRALLQALANMTLLEANRPPWPRSWFSSERRPWRDGVVDSGLIPDVPSDFERPLADQAKKVLEEIDDQLAAAYGETAPGAA